MLQRRAACFKALELQGKWFPLLAATSKQGRFTSEHLNTIEYCSTFYSHFCVVFSFSRPEWAAAAYASYGIASPFVPMYEQQHETDVQYILNDSKSVVLFVSKRSILEKVSLLIVVYLPYKSYFILAGFYS